MRFGPSVTLKAREDIRVGGDTDRTTRPLPSLGGVLGYLRERVAAVSVRAASSLGTNAFTVGTRRFLLATILTEI
jgi:hypothetical protein